MIAPNVPTRRLFRLKTVFLKASLQSKVGRSKDKNSILGRRFASPFLTFRSLPIPADICHNGLKIPTMGGSEEGDNTQPDMSGVKAVVRLASGMIFNRIVNQENEVCYCVPNSTHEFLKTLVRFLSLVHYSTRMRYILTILTPFSRLLDTPLKPVLPFFERKLCYYLGEDSNEELPKERTATAGSDVVQSGRPIFDDFFQHLWPYIGNNTVNVVFQMVKRLWLIRIDQ
ncbi:hypothetical protein TNCV_1424851 [Trichonephila clavipes]|nr:hypothetical protein TNCV_1424851 [Trichonephila clavipes]